MKRLRIRLAIGFFIAVLGHGCVCHEGLQNRVQLQGPQKVYYPVRAGLEYSPTQDEDAFAILERHNTSGGTGIRRHDHGSHWGHTGFENMNFVVGRERPDSVLLSYRNAATKEREARSALGRAWGYFIISLLLFSILYSVIIMPKLHAFRSNNPGIRDNMRAFSAMIEREKVSSGVGLASAFLLLVTGILCGIRAVLWGLRFVIRIYLRLLKAFQPTKQPLAEDASGFVPGSEASGLDQFAETAAGFSTL